MTNEDPNYWRKAFDFMRAASYLKESMGCWAGYRTNPSRSQSSPWATPDYLRRWHPFDALLAERRAILAGERAALEAAAGKDKAWWDEMRRG